MGTYLILVALLSMCSLSFSQECNREFLENIDFPGADITSLYSPDVEHCQQLCTQHPSCLFFTFLGPDWTTDNRQFFCYLKSTPSGTPTVQTPLQHVTSGFSLKSCNPDLQPCLSKVYENVDFLGADYRSSFTSNYEECQRVCTQDPQYIAALKAEIMSSVEISLSGGTVAVPRWNICGGMTLTFMVWYKCHLKYSWTVPRTLNVNNKGGVVSGFSHKIQLTPYFEPACQSQLFPNMDIPGNYFENLLAASPEHCQTLCSAHPQCTYFSFVSDTFTCYLKNNLNEMVTTAKKGVTSGIPGHFCQLDDSWLKVAQEGVDFQDSDIRFELMDDPETCQKTCTTDSICQYYTYVTATFSDPVYRRRCYLKRVITMPAPPKINKLNNVVSGFTLRNCA